MARASHILAIDIGNSNITYGLYKNGSISRKGYLSCSPRPKREEVEGVIASISKGRTVVGMSVSSVGPAMTQRWLHGCRQILGVEGLLLDHGCDYGFPLSYAKPETLGTDRLVDACWAVEKYGSPVIVADFGTATTIDLVLPDQGYVGGVIAPGMPLMVDYMEERTALLPKIEVKAIRRAVGRSTEEAMQIGARWGFIGMARELISRMKQTLNGQECSICLTGGYAGRVSAGLGIPVIVDANLTLCGLGKAYELNAD